MGNRKTRMSRRTALKTFGLGAASLYLPGCTSFLTRRPSGFGGVMSADKRRIHDAEAFSPIDRNVPAVAPREFSGDQAARAHALIREKFQYTASLGELPPPRERVPLVAIGGGMAGLFASYLLRDHKPVILEQADRFGGNSRGESWEGIDYSIGAAYFSVPDEGSPLHKIYSELGMSKLAAVKTTEDPVLLKNLRYNSFWEGETDPAHPKQFRKLKRYFQDVLAGKNGRVFPDIPALDAESRRYINSLDKISFLDHLQRIAGGPLHPHIKTALEYYSWSAFTAPLSQVSAAAGLNFYASEFGEIYVAPGGNAAVAERFVQILSNDLPSGHLRPGSIVFNVEVVDDGVIVTYQDQDGQVRSLHAQAAVMACPKFVAARVIKDLEEDRLEAIRRLRYHSYLVCNVLVKDRIQDAFYDLFLLGNGQVDQTREATDVILGTFAHPNPTGTILTLYRGFPQDEARTTLFMDEAFETFRSRFERQVEEEVLPAVGIDKSKVSDIRIARWGHPIPVAETGLISDGVVDRIREPFRDRVFFVQQDNWMLPALETCATEALAWAPEIETLLKAGAL